MKYCLLFGLLFSVGCAHTHIKSWEGKQFTVCGNKWAATADLDKVAADQCGAGAYRALAGGESDTGNLYVQSYGYGNVGVHSKKEYCTTYQCN